MQSGDRITFTNSHERSTDHLRVVCRSDGSLSFMPVLDRIRPAENRKRSRQGFLRILPNGTGDASGARNGALTAFSLVPSGPDGVILTHNKSGAWVDIGLDGEFVASTEPQLLHVQKQSQALPIDRTALSQEDIEHFKEKGYVVLRNAVCHDLVRGALHEINSHFGRPDSWSTDSSTGPTLKLENSTCGEVGCAILNQSSKFWSSLHLLLGEGNVESWERGQQVALRFPEPPHKGYAVPDEKPGTQYHIDGMGENKLCPFSLLCGVALSDQTRESCGNLHVFPGSHLHPELQQYYRERINEDAQGEDDTRKPDLGQSVQVLLAPGDVVLAHQLLAHRVGVNTTENIRYQLYYRVSHKEHAVLKERILDDPWVEFAC